MILNFVFISLFVQANDNLKIYVVSRRRVSKFLHCSSDTGLVALNILAVVRQRVLSARITAPHYYFPYSPLDVLGSPSS